MDIKAQVYGLAFGVAVSVLVAVAGSLTGIESLQDISLAGIAVTAIRSLATAVVTLLGAQVPGVTARQ